MQCSVADCDRQAEARGWCGMHYQRWLAHGNPEIVHGVSKLRSRTAIPEGTRYGGLIVGSRHRTNGRSYYQCLCDCGNATVVLGSNLKAGKTRSCGCAWRETPTWSVTHGMSATATYGSWSQMRTRCRNPQYTEWHYYGGRGIAVCERWDSFENFLADMGTRPNGTTLDRIDPEGNYEPRNCRWATAIEQTHNRRPWGSARSRP